MPIEPGQNAIHEQRMVNHDRRSAPIAPKVYLPALLSAVLLIGGMLLARWLTTPEHPPGQIIITPQNIAQLVGRRGSLIGDF